MAKSRDTYYQKREVQLTSRKEQTLEWTATNAASFCTARDWFISSNYLCWSSLNLSPPTRTIYIWHHSTIYCIILHASQWSKNISPSQFQTITLHRCVTTLSPTAPSLPLYFHFNQTISTKHSQRLSITNILQETWLVLECELLST